MTARFPLSFPLSAGFVAAITLLSWPRSGHADTPSGAPAVAAPAPAAPPAPSETTSTTPSTTPTATDVGAAPARPENGMWSVGKPRWFLATKSDLGTPYLKPYFQFGYGLPHWIYAGLDVNAISTLEFVQGYAGVRASSPVLDLAFGYRDTQSFNKPFLAPANSYSRGDVVTSAGPRSRYWAWEAEAVAIAPLPHSALVADFILVKTLDVPNGKYVYDESYRAVVAKPLFAVMRIAAVARFLHENAMKIGVLMETVFLNGRDHAVIRVGPAGALQITDHLEVLGTLTLAVYSPDTLGLALGAYGVAGLRYRWATGESDPKLPWRGNIIP